jgi:predicted nucleic acid-binding protein
VIFSNTTPFISLSAIGHLDLLPALFGQIHVVEPVVLECAAGGNIAVPSLGTLPWVTVLPVAGGDPEPMLTQLDEGEKWTLHAARQAGAEILLIDERIGRNLAERMGLKVTGTLGVLLKARQRGLIASFSGAALEMRSQGIFFHPRLIARLAESIGET